MTVSALLGMFLGFVSAVPVAGPMSAFILSRGMKEKYAEGRWAALGAALSESIYCFLAFWGFSRFLPRFPRVFLAANLLGAGILFSLGIYFLRSKKMRSPLVESNAPQSAGSLRAFAVGAGISAMNPSLLATWGAAIAALYSMRYLEYSLPNAAVFSAGVGVGIVAWFSIFLRIIRKFRGRFDERTIDRFLEGFAVLLFALGFGMIYRALIHGMLGR